MTWRLIALIALLLATACAQRRVDMHHPPHAQLLAIAQAFDQGIQSAKAQGQWHSGWLGNIATTALPGERAGVCTEWQELAFLAVRDTVRQQQWDLRMVRINGQTLLEHNALIVFDPAAIRADQLHLADRTSPAYVLDGWLRGMADVFTIPDWLATQGPKFKSMEIFDADEELRLRNDDTLKARGLYPSD